MSLLTLVQNACGQVPVAAPASVIDNPDVTVQLALALANLAGQGLARRPQGGWVDMIREYDFVTAATANDLAGTVTNSGAGGVAVIVVQTSAVTSPLVTANNWQATGTGIPNNAIVTNVGTNIGGFTAITINQPATQTGLGQFQFGQSDYALPADFQRPIDNTFWDRSRYWAMRGPQSPQQWQLYKSSIIGRATIQRRFRFRRISLPDGDSPVMMLSIDPVPFDNGASLVFEYVSLGWCESISGVPQLQWEADTDVGVIDEYLIQLSLNYRLLQRLGLAYAEQLNEFERRTDAAMSADGGAAILSIAPINTLALVNPFQIQDGNFPSTPATS